VRERVASEHKLSAESAALLDGCAACFSDLMRDSDKKEKRVMSASLAVRINPDNPDHHLPPSPLRATGGRDGGGPGELSIRIHSGNPDHHLWLNNGTWFVHYTIWPTPVTKKRVRRSLGTKSRVRARAQRDVLFGALPAGGAA
jgi:hypothetical protein